MRTKNFHAKAISLLIIICSLITYNMLYFSKSLEATQAAIKEASQQSAAAPTGTYKDGTYDGTASGYGGQVTCQIKISSGYIADIAVVSASSEDAAYYNAAVSVLDEIAAEQSADDIDTVSGATYTSEGLIGACQEALKKASLE